MHHRRQNRFIVLICQYLALSTVINLVDRAYIYDNSENSELLFRTVKNNGKHGMRFEGKIALLFSSVNTLLCPLCTDATKELVVPKSMPINSENSELLFRTVKNNGKHGMRFYKGHNSWAWGIHNTCPLCTDATKELVVPKSMPIANLC
jgi:hypothetical protein